MLPYSAKKNNANAIAEYSTLYPATNSASASGKSKGVLLVSANATIKNIIQKGSNGNMKQICSCDSTMFNIEKLPDIIITDEKVAPIANSYEIICEADLIPPKKAYLELLDHPANIIPYTLNDEIESINNVDNGRLIDINPLCDGIISHIKIVQKNVNNGAIKNSKIFEFEGTINSFSSNLTPSAIGCKRPNRPVVFGPLRLCILLIVLRSNNVKNAIVINTVIKTIIKLIIYVNINLYVYIE